MKCFECGSTLDQTDICPGCGRNVHAWKQIGMISDHLYNEGLAFAKKRFLTDAKEKLTLSLIYNKKNTKARNLLGLILYETGEYYQAFSEWLISLELVPVRNPAQSLLYRAREERLGVDRMHQAIRKYNQSLVNCRQGNFDLAIIQLNQVTEANPGFIRARLLMALALMQTGRHDEALRHLDRVYAVDKNHPDEQRYRAECRRYLTRDGRLKQKKKSERITVKEHVRIFADHPLFTTVLNLVIGAAAGAAIVGFLVVPGMRSAAASANSSSLVEANQTISSKNETITGLEEEKSTLQADLEKEQEARKKADNTVTGYEALFQAKSLFDQEKYEEAGKTLEAVDADLLSEDAKALYDDINADVLDAMLMGDYNTALQKYWDEDWKAAAKAFRAITDQKKDFNDCQAAFYLGDAYLELGDTEKAKTWLTYCVDHTSSESVRAKANRKLRVANGEPEYEETEEADSGENADTAENADTGENSEEGDDAE